RQAHLAPQAPGVRAVVRGHPEARPGRHLPAALARAQRGWPVLRQRDVPQPGGRHRPGRSGRGDRGRGLPGPEAGHVRRRLAVLLRQRPGRLELGVPGQIMPPAAAAVKFAQRAEADGFDAIWWPDHLMGWHPDSLWTPDLTPLAASQPNPHTYFDPLVMMG